MCDCTCPRYIHIGPKLAAKIDRAVKRAELHLKPDIAWVRYRIGEDWTGDTSIFYYLILQKYEPEKSHELVQKAVDLLNNFCDIDEIGIHYYSNVRSVAEMDKIGSRIANNPKDEFAADYENWRRL